MMGKSQRAKGRAFEREVARDLQAIYPKARRGLSQSRSGREVPDVEGAGPWWPEAKAGARPNIVAALEQAEAASDGRVPLVVAKVDRRGIIAAMRWSEMLALLTEIERLRARSEGAA
jgi:hypothetical protein